MWWRCGEREHGDVDGVQEWAWLVADNTDTVKAVCPLTHMSLWTLCCAIEGIYASSAHPTVRGSGIMSCVKVWWDAQPWKSTFISKSTEPEPSTNREYASKQSNGRSIVADPSVAAFKICRKRAP